MTRRTRQRVVDPDGVERVQTKPPRVDVLHYPATGWTTLLVRRTHDEDLAAELAYATWADLQDTDRVPADVFLAGHRVGWWTTAHARPDAPRRGFAFDDQGRPVVFAPDPGAVWSPGPGVEFLPDRIVDDPRTTEPQGQRAASHT